MTRALARTNFHSSALLRHLVDLGVAGAGDAGDAFAEKLGAWIHFADAISLSAVHTEPPAASSARRADQDHAEALRQQLERTRSQLSDSIQAGCFPGRHKIKSHIVVPEPILELPLDLGAAYAPYRRFHAAYQRDMELNIRPLRVNARDALARTNPRLRKLAELDACFEKILIERESKLLARIPGLLGKRFGELFHAHQQQLADAGLVDEPAHWVRPDGWLTRFVNEMQAVLLSELELRLQPAIGLIDAYNQDIDRISND